MSDETEPRKPPIRRWAWGLGLLVLGMYLGYIVLAVIRLPGAVGN